MIKVFVSDSGHGIEFKMNEWLETSEEKIVIDKLQYAMAGEDRHSNVFSCLVEYHYDYYTISEVKK